MNKEALKKYRVTNGMLAGVLGVLIIAIVALVIGLIVIPKNGGEDQQQIADSGQSENGNAPDGQFVEEGIYEIDMHSDGLDEINLQTADMDVDEATSTYQNYIDSASEASEKEKGKVELGRYLIGKGYYPRNNGLLEEGFAQLESVDENQLDTKSKMLLYSTYRDYFDAMGNTEQSDIYNNKIGEITEGSEYALGT